MPDRALFQELLWCRDEGETAPVPIREPAQSPTAGICGGRRDNEDSRRRSAGSRSERKPARSWSPKTTYFSRWFGCRVAITRRDTLDNILCSGARHEGTAANYLYRNGVRHLLGGGNADSAGRLLTDIEFLVGRLGRIRSGEMVTQSASETLSL